MHSILGRGSFSTNSSISEVWHGSGQPGALPMHCWAFSSSVLLDQLFLICLLKISHRFHLFRSGMLAGQSVLSEKRTLNHWETVQFFFSLVQVRCFWWLCFSSGLVRRLSVVTLDALNPASVHSLWSSPTCLDWLCLTIFSSLLLVYLFLLDFFQSTLHLICFDTALLEQPLHTIEVFTLLPFQSWVSFLKSETK